MHSRSRPGRILLVDDDRALRHAIGDACSHDAGYSVLQAADGPEALASSPAAQPVDLMLLDIGLPGMSGLDVLQQVRRPRGASARGDHDRRRHAGDAAQGGPRSGGSLRHASRSRLSAIVEVVDDVARGAAGGGPADRGGVGAARVGGTGRAVLAAESPTAFRAS